MKKGIIIALSLLLIVSTVTASNFYKETKQYQADIGETYVDTVREARNLTNELMGISLDEAVQTEYGEKLISYINRQIRNIEIQWMESRNMNRVLDLLEEIYQIQNNALEKGKVSKEDLDVYKNNLKTVNLIMMDFQHNLDSRQDWYNIFVKGEDHEILGKIDQRIEEDYF